MTAYGTDDGFASWLSANGYALPPSSPTPQALRMRASDYIDATYGSRFVGIKAGGYEQEREWPRVSAVAAGGQSIPSDITPPAVVRATYVAALLEAESQGVLSGSGSLAGAVKREKVDGAVEVEYRDGGSDFIASATFKDTRIDGLLHPLLKRDVDGCLFLTTIG